MSRLQLLQARFQQKQLQEKEQKLLQLYDQQRQRAHQVAQRGSANGNPVTTIGNNNHHAAHHPTPKARHMQHERLGQQQKGIDKSYPLEPLDGVTKPRKPSLHRARRTGSKPDVNSNSESQESIPATSTSSSRVNGHYEINIDEVIDDEAMQRNRMYAKFQPRTTVTAETTTTPSVPLQRKNTTAKKPTAMASPSTRKTATTPTNTTTPTTNGSSPGISSGTPAPEPKSRPQAGATKSSSMKFLSRIVGTNGDLEFTSENGYSSARKSSLPRQDSPPLPAQHSTDSTAQSQSQQQKTGPPVTPAPRTSTTLSSPNSAGTKVGSSPSKRVSKVKLGGAGAKSSPGHDSVDSNLTACKICSRRFTSERIALHEQICAKTAAKKRKQFDVQTHRVKGTELESFHKPLKSKNQKSSSSSHSSAVKAAEPENKLPKSNWRRKHEDFINAIRSAKQMQAYLASGGKLSDLPPPPPSDTSDYVQCPHCSRKFNSGAAQRHIPKCQTMQHNKPKVAVRSKR